MMPSRKWLAIFFVAALVLYTPGIWWGLPDGTASDRIRTWGTDELAPVSPVFEIYSVLIARNPGFNPQYPLFHYMCQFVLVAPYYAGLWLTGHLSGPSPNFPFGLDNPRAELGVMTVLARLVSLLMAAGVVAIAFRTGEILRDRRTGILAALMVLLQYPMFFYARTSNVDMGALFWTALGLWLFALCMTRGITMRRGIALGICAALATASKDPSYGAFLPVGVVFLVWHVQASRQAGKGWRETLRVPAYALATAVVVYLVSSGLVLRPSRYLRHFQYITHGPTGTFYFRYPPTLEGYFDFGREFVTQLVDAMGLPMLLCTVAGLALWIVRQRRLLLWLLPALGVFVAAILPVRFVLLRFVLIIAYVLAFPAADVLARGLSQSDSVRRWAAQAVLATVVVWAGVRGADLTYQMLHDSRYIAADWLSEHIVGGDRVGHLVFAYNLPRLPASTQTVSLRASSLEASLADARPEFIISIPLEDFEHEHERLLPEDIYQRLVAGTIGYRPAALLQGPSLFRKRPATFVNPPVRVFVREDVWQRRLAVGR